MEITQEENECLVFNIQRYSIHDGPGIRTIVFLKNCPLRCAWCSNPEGVDAWPILSYNNVLCGGCGRCAGACPRGALSFDGGVKIARGKCGGCGSCAEVCPSGALKLFGRRMSVTEVLDEVKRDEAFYRRSGGGLTLSGGEPLASPDFSLALLKRARLDCGFDTAVETTLYAPPETVEKILPWINHIFADIKLMDARKHREYTGADNALILENIRRVAASGADLTVRFPLIPEINDSEDNLTAMAEFLAGCAKPPPLEVLPYHEFGRGKFSHLGREYPLAAKKIPVPDRKKTERTEDFLREKGVRIVRT